MDKATLDQYFKICDMLKTGEIEQTLALAIIEGRVEICDVESFFVPLMDANIPGPRSAIGKKYRELACLIGVPTETPICYKVKSGYSLPYHAPKHGQCRNNFDDLKDRSRSSHESTRNCLAFWVPRNLEIRTGLNAAETLMHLRRDLDLPKHHLNPRGENSSLVAGLILAHLKMTGEKVPQGGMFVKTKTVVYPQNGYGSSDSLYLGGHGEGGLCWASQPGYDTHCVIAIGIEEI